MNDLILSVKGYAIKGDFFLPVAITVYSIKNIDTRKELCLS